MARRTRRTSAISSDSESEAIISVPEVTPKAAPKTRRFQEDMRDISRLMHEQSYVPLVHWSFNTQENTFILTDSNGEIKLTDLLHLMMLAKPYILDLDKLPLNNPDDGADGRSGVRLIRKRAQNNILRKEEVTLRKQHCFRRITYSSQRLYKTKASEDQHLKVFQNILSSSASEDSSQQLPQQTKTSEEIPSSKTVAEHSQSTKGTDTRHAGLMTDRDNM
ncbi:hypothetical protein E3N88_09478 [Mikania micrantha]|uniref:HSF-type DNA-binding domain-containing protein n=1 Tax=Mikania micrantha TaxID=192012 RepID=A0A5N6PJV2_9ASTR|nr:hypothetical protein E3N88_09478 [Mikania micrantha]